MKIKLYSKFVLLLLMIASCMNSVAQTKQTEKINQVWLAYFNQTRLSNKWGVWGDFHLRTKEDFTNSFSQSLLRVGVTYYINDVTKFTLGYGYITNYPGDNHKQINQVEHRPWQQIQWHTKYGKKRMMQWFRLEEKYKQKILNDSTLASGNSFSWKVRYNFWYDIPLSKKGIVPKAWSFVVNDELHINFGKQIVNNYFDQNRFFLGFKYQVNEHSNLQFGYMNLFQQTAAGNKYKSINAARVFFFQNIDARRKK